jgi:hypothetical protein
MLDLLDYLGNLEILICHMGSVEVFTKILSKLNYFVPDCYVGHFAGI